MGHELRTRLCHEMDIEYPIFSVGFGDGARPGLVAAVSNAGGFGVLGAGGTGEGTVIGKRTSINGAPQEWPRYAVGAIPPDFERDLVRDAEAALK
ncbi:MAG TPA: nitronate monooxygenase [Candidatus Dormibacteraeota bacterium]|jgi:NAD(P)H-dependent flavin oxidoreductase YrpB (nitropropane dioxygenase family)